MRVIISAGGTAGHINPAIAVANKLKDEAEIIFVGTKHGMENDLVTRAGFEIKHLDVIGIKRKITLDNLKVVYKAFKALADAKKIIKEFRPDVVIGFGGYVTGPMLLCAYLLGIPTLIHEQNAVAGFTTKVLSKIANTVAVSFDGTNLGKKVLTGNPVSVGKLNITKEQAKQKLGIKQEKCVLVFGGSLGAEKINKICVDISVDLPSVGVYIGTGKKKFDDVCKMSNKNENLYIVDYIYDMETAYIASDIVVCRSGATSVSELCVLGKPSILIPSPNVTNNHQEKNAREVQNAGGCIMICENELTGEKLKKCIEDLLDDDNKLEKMGQCARSLGKIDADQRIYDEIKKLL